MCANTDFFSRNNFITVIKKISSLIFELSYKMLNTEQHFRFRIFKRFPLAESERKRERGRWDCFPLEGRGISRGKLARVAKGKWVIPRFVFPRDKSGRGVATKSWRESRAHLSRALTAYERRRDTRYRFIIVTISNCWTLLPSRDSASSYELAVGETESASCLYD